MSRERSDGGALGDLVQRDAARLNTFLAEQRASLLRQARRRRAGATDDERRWVEGPVSDPKEMERRLEEGFDALTDRMDGETAAAAARLMAILAASSAEAERDGGDAWTTDDFAL